MAPTKPYRARSKRLTKTRTEKNGIFANLSHLYHTKICFMLFLKWSKFLLGCNRLESNFRIQKTRVRKNIETRCLVIRN